MYLPVCSHQPCGQLLHKNRQWCLSAKTSSQFAFHCALKDEYHCYLFDGQDPNWAAFTKTWALAGGDQAYTQTFSSACWLCCLVKTFITTRITRKSRLGCSQGEGLSACCESRAWPFLAQTEFSKWSSSTQQRLHWVQGSRTQPTQVLRCQSGHFSVYTCPFRYMQEGMAG